MMYGSSSTCIWFCVYVTLAVSTVAAHKDRSPREIPDYLHDLVKGKVVHELPSTLLYDEKACYMTCPGPVAHYKSLNCTPVYYNDNCCPMSYDCNHLNDSEKCFVNGHKYEIGERISKNDTNLCEEDCICRKGENGPADFQCTSREELCPAYKPSNTSCYQRNSLNQCCPDPSEVCQTEDRRPICHVHGDVYLDGEYVVPKYKPNLICICLANNTDEMSWLMCKKSKHWFWSDIHATTGFYKNCTPVYLPRSENMIGIHRQTWRCPNANDEVICVKGFDQGAHGPLMPVSITSLNMCNMLWSTGVASSEAVSRCKLFTRHKQLCIFGQQTMHVGDRLNNVAYGNDSYIVCTCEVPPVPTCVLRDKTFC